VLTKSLIAGQFHEIILLVVERLDRCVSICFPHVSICAVAQERGKLEPVPSGIFLRTLIWVGVCMGVHWKQGGYSATVEMYLLVEGERHEIAQIGPSFLLLSHPRLINSGHAQIVIRVDDHEEIQDVILCQSDPASLELAYA
jgi:hypothetical protein